MGAGDVRSAAGGGEYVAGSDAGRVRRVGIHRKGIDAARARDGGDVFHHREAIRVRVWETGGNGDHRTGRDGGTGGDARGVRGQRRSRERAHGENVRARGRRRGDGVSRRRAITDRGWRLV